MSYSFSLKIISRLVLTLTVQTAYEFFFTFQNLGKDQGGKANGKGWILTIALIKGTNLASVEATELFDPYVIFTCNGKTRTSSVKLQARDPQWNGNQTFSLVCPFNFSKIPVSRSLFNSYSVSLVSYCH